ncbi:Imm44 family immunity protein [Yersinia pseudotuberculosis]|uniref:Imm44 family immunity protein n=1 Tax=Yersinia pseudotuberculosis TaxID=633 RepID=UPI00402BB653
MKLWVSSEADIDVAELYRETRIFIEKQVNSNLDEITFDHDYDKWAFIVMIRDSKNWADEVAKRHIKRKVLEFRLKIDHNEFLNGNFSQRANLFLDALQRSIDKMENLGISLEDRNKLYGILASVKSEL